MKTYLYGFKICISLLCLGIVGCTPANENPIKLTSEVPATQSATMATTLQPTDTPLATSQPNVTLTPAADQIVLPAVTMDPQQAENALLELLKTNGNCTGKCIAGIRPDDMAVQDAVNEMAQWGMVRIDKNSQGKTFINLVQNPLNGVASVHLSVGTWTKEFETIDRVSFYLAGPPGELFLGDDLWIANRDVWQAFQFNRLLKAYGVPSYVGYFFQTTVEVGAPLEGRTISYTMDIHYARTNVVVTIGALAFYDGDLFICPSKDPHDLGIEITPERPLTERQDVYPLTWQALTGTDLDMFYQMFTTNPDACITTTLEQIQALQPSFR